MKILLRLGVLTVLSGFSLLLSGCAIHGNQAPTGQGLDDALGIGGMPPHKLDRQSSILDQGREKSRALDVQSDLLHHFLVGQLALDTEDRTRAYMDLKKANALASEPIIQKQVGQLLLAQGKLNEAQREFQKLLAEGSQLEKNLDGSLGHSGILLLSAWLHVGTGRYGEALTLLQQNPNVVGRERVFIQTAALLGQNKTAEAVRVLQANSQDPFIGFALGRLLEESGKFDEAKPYFKNCIQNQIIGRDAVVGLARIEAKRQSLKDLEAVTDAVSELTVPVELVPFKTEFIRRLESGDRVVIAELLEEPDSIQTAQKLLSIAAQDNLRSQNLELAFNELYLGLALDPSDSNRYQLGLLLAQAGRMGEAAELMLQIPPGSELYVRARVFAGVAFRQIKKFKRAEKILKEGLAQVPDSEPLESVLLLVLRQEKKFEDAKEIYQAILKREPGNEKVMFSYGVLLQEMNKPDEALKVMEAIAASNPNNSEALNYVAYALAEEKRDLSRAESIIKKALVAQPKNAYFIDTLAWVYFHQGRHSEALDAIKKAMSFEPNDPEVLEHYGDILTKTMQPELAAKIYDQAKDAARLSDEADAGERVSRIAKKIKDLNRQTVSAGK